MFDKTQEDMTQQTSMIIRLYYQPKQFSVEAF